MIFEAVIPDMMLVEKVAREAMDKEERAGSRWRKPERVNIRETPTAPSAHLHEAAGPERQLTTM